MIQLGGRRRSNHPSRQDQLYRNGNNARQAHAPDYPERAPCRRSHAPHRCAEGHRIGDDTRSLKSKSAGMRFAVVGCRRDGGRRGSGRGVRCGCWRRIDCRGGRVPVSAGKCICFSSSAKTAISAVRVFDLVLALRQCDKPLSEIGGVAYIPTFGIIDVALQRGNTVLIGILHVRLVLHQSCQDVIVENQIAGRRRDRSPRRRGSAETRRRRQSGESPKCGLRAIGECQKETMAVRLWLA